jgi:hypothetical protein
MKKLNLWLFASLFVAAFSLTACSSDDDDNSSGSSGNPTSIEGKWVGEWAANPDDSNHLMWRYAHKLFYTFKDGNFEIIESACWYTTEADAKQYDKASISIDPARPAGAYLAERISHKLIGTYKLDGSKITLLPTKESWGDDDNFASMDDVSYYGEQSFDYKITGNKLKIGDGTLVPVSPHNLIVYDEMTWQGK